MPVNDLKLSRILNKKIFCTENIKHLIPICSCNFIYLSAWTVNLIQGYLIKVIEKVLSQNGILAIYFLTPFALV